MQGAGSTLRTSQRTRVFTWFAIILAAAVIATFAASAFAATEYYVAQDAKTHACSVTDKKPDGKTMTMVGKAGYETKVKAEAAMKAAAECKA